MKAFYPKISLLYFVFLVPPRECCVVAVPNISNAITFTGRSIVQCSAKKINEVCMQLCESSQLPINDTMFMHVDEILHIVYPVKFVLDNSVNSN